jgi:Zn-dependent metalloprotease
MMKLNHDPVHCIVPPHILEALTTSPDEDLRKLGIRALAMSARLKGRRDIMSQAMPALSAGAMRRTIYDAKNGTNLPGDLVRGEGDDPVSDKAADEAYDALGATYDFYKEVYKRNSLDDRGFRLDASVHFDDDYDNAFFDGRQMVFGDGDNVIFVGFTKAIDVVAHELTHGVTQFTANLEYHDQSGALNESMSDVFGSLVKQYGKKQTADKADWLIGSGILAPGVNGKALRSMKAPGTAYNDPKLGGKDPQPAHMKDYKDFPNSAMGDNGGVHINSGIPNHAFYLAATKIGGNAWEGAGQVWYNALLRLWATAQFQDCADVTHETAGTLFGTNSAQQQAVAEAWSEVGLEIKSKSPAARAAAKRRPRPAPVPAHGNGHGRGHHGNGHDDGDLRKRLEQISEELEEVMSSLH